MARIPQEDGVRLLSGPKGSVVLVSSEKTRLAEIAFRGTLVAAQMRGAEITPGLVKGIARRALALEAKHLAAAQERGVAGNIRKLFRAKRKKEVLRIAKEMAIEEGALSDLIHNCGTLGLSHHSKHHDFVPPGRELTGAERAVLRSSEQSDAKPRVEKKVRQLFAAREHRSIHLFANHQEWHCFYLTFRDIAGDPVTGQHHWKEGAHLHYISHLLCNLTREQVWVALDERQHSLGSVHVRYRHEGDGKRPRRFLHVDVETERVLEVPAE